MTQYYKLVTLPPYFKVKCVVNNLLLYISVSIRALYVANEEQTLSDAFSFLVSVWYDCVIVLNITETFTDEGRKELTRPM